MRGLQRAAALAAAILISAGCADDASPACPGGQGRDGAGACRAGCAGDAACDDGDPCNGQEVCTGGLCWPGTPVRTAACRPCAEGCDDGNPCTDDACEGRYCRHTPNAAPCDDGIACTGGDTCHEGICAAGAPDDARCSDGVGCTRDRCDPLEGCSHLPDDTACADPFDCTADSCHPTADCQHVPVHALCGDGIVCTADSCEPSRGCVHTPAPEACDDGVACTADTCDPVVGCVFPPDHAACDDGVGCTRDVCDGRGGCRSEPDDSLCLTGECEQGTCDAQAGCLVAARPNLTPCGTDGLCLSAQCALFAEGAAARTDAPPCAPTAFAVQDLAYSGAEAGFLALADLTAGGWSGGACSAPVGRAGVFRFDGGAYAAYGADLPGRGHALADPFVLVESGASHAVGVLDFADHSVDWSDGNFIQRALDGLAGVGVLRRGTVFDTGRIFLPTSTRNLLLAGSSSTTPSDGIVVSCTWTQGGLCPPPGPCLPAPACAVKTTAAGSTFQGLQAWTTFSGGVVGYAGALAAVDLVAGGRRVLNDGADRDRNLTDAARTDSTGTWAGVLRTGAPGEHLIYGSDAVVCRDKELTGGISCSRLIGARPDRYYYDGVALPGGGFALLARSVCSGTCLYTSYYLVGVRKDLPLEQAAWEERILATQRNGFPPIPVAVPQRVAAGGGGLLVLGVNSARTGAYSWSWQPPP